MTNTAKHFTCYALLLIAWLFTFGLYQKTRLDGAITAQKLAGKMNAVAHISQENTTNIRERDAQIQKLNLELLEEQGNSRIISEQIADLAKVQQVQQKVLDKPGPNPSTPPVLPPIVVKIDPEGLQPGTPLPVESMSLDTPPDFAPVSYPDMQSPTTLVRVRHPRTHLQKFRTGLKWVFSLGLSKQ